MSLIADALKAAQREKAKRARANEPEAPASFYSASPARATRRTFDVEWRKTILPVGAVLALLIAGWALNALLRKDAATEAERAALLVDTAAVMNQTEPAPSYIVEEIEPDVADIAGDAEPQPLAFAPVSRPLPRARDEEVAAPAAVSPAAASPVIPPPSSAATNAGLKIEVQQLPLVGGNPLVAQALAAYNRRDYAGARDYYERALATGVASPEIYNNLGTAYRNLGDLARAEQAYQSAIALNSRSAPAWSNLGVVLYSLGRKREATAAYEEAIRLDPGNASTKVNLAILYVETALYPEAKRLLEEALTSAPTLAEAHYTYAQVLEIMKDNAAAIRHYETFLSISGGKYQELEKRVRTRLERMKAAR